MADAFLANGKRPEPARQAWRWMRANLFGGVFSSIATLLAVYLIARAGWALADWAVIHAVWSAPDGRACIAASGGKGACWAFLGYWARFILFGRYPYAEQWRPLVVVVLFVALLLASCARRLLGWRIAVLWLAGIAINLVLMAGGVAGLEPVGTDRWSGLPLTLILAIVGLALAFPLAIVLALARRSSMPAVRALAVAYIELVRGVPLITVLFMASVMLPLFLPAGVTVNNLLRAQLGFVLFYAAYLAEVVRGGLQAIPKGQEEAADALGLGFGRKMALVILPLALKIAIPPLVNVLIAGFKDTTLVTIIGLFDLMSTAANAITDPRWRGFYPEAYAFVAVIYFAFCFFMSRYSQALERSLAGGRR
ncbi:MAG TPA: amino acid ABC transporter permease [Stellaceae bacterium]|nr:amino acid ABC transporter permease [Stellaceae bacterium]